MEERNCKLCNSNLPTKNLFGFWLCDSCYKDQGGKISDNELKERDELQRLKEKYGKLSEIDKEHIENGRDLELIRKLAKSTGETSRGQKLGYLYFRDNESIAVYTNIDCYRNITVWGHNHPVVNLKLEYKDEAKEMMIKQAALMGFKISCDKRGNHRIFIGRIRKGRSKK